MSDIYGAGWWMWGLNGGFLGWVMILGAEGLGGSGGLCVEGGVGCGCGDWMKDLGWLDGDCGAGCRVWSEMKWVEIIGVYGSFGVRTEILGVNWSFLGSGWGFWG